MENSSEFLGVQDLFRAALFQNGPVHQDHFVGVLGEHSKIVGDHQNGQVEALADLVQHIHQIILSFHIHAGQGLVQNQDIGQGLQSQRQQNPLQLSAVPDIL